MQFEGAVIEEQGTVFAIVVVTQAVLNNDMAAEKTRQMFARVFAAMPVILMAQDERGVPVYSGRPDIVRFLSQVHISQIPWERYEFSL